MKSAPSLPDDGITLIQAFLSLTFLAFTVLALMYPKTKMIYILFALLMYHVHSTNYKIIIIRQVCFATMRIKMAVLFN